MINLKKNLITLLKFSIGIGLISYLIFKGNIDLQILYDAIYFHIGWLLLGLSLFAFVLLISSIRWKMLLKAQKANITLWKAVNLNFIGLFFNISLPGPVGGDLAKCYYITSIYPDKKAATVTTILIDRFLRLSGLVLLAGISVIINYKISLYHSDIIKSLSSSILAVSIGIILGIIFFLNAPMSFFDAYPEIFSCIPLGKYIQKFYQSIKIYRDHQFVIYFLLLLSMLIHLIIIIITFIFGKIFLSTLPLRLYTLVTPFGLLANVLPISPGGLGVGEVVFEYFYKQFGSSFGGEIMALLHLTLIFWGLLGLPFYLFIKKETNYSPPRVSNLFKLRTFFDDRVDTD